MRSNGATAGTSRSLKKAQKNKLLPEAHEFPSQRVRCHEPHQHHRSGVREAGGRPHLSVPLFAPERAHAQPRVRRHGAAVSRRISRLCEVRHGLPRPAARPRGDARDGAPARRLRAIARGRAPHSGAPLRSGRSRSCRRYWFSIGVWDPNRSGLADRVERAISFEVVPADVYGSGYDVQAREGAVFADFEWEVRPVENGRSSPRTERRRCHGEHDAADLHGCDSHVQPLRAAAICDRIRASADLQGRGGARIGQPVDRRHQGGSGAIRRRAAQVRRSARTLRNACTLGVREATGPWGPDPAPRRRRRADERGARAIRRSARPIRRRAPLLQPGGVLRSGFRRTRGELADLLAVHRFDVVDRARRSARPAVQDVETEVPDGPERVRVLPRARRAQSPRRRVISSTRRERSTSRGRSQRCSRTGYRMSRCRSCSRVARPSPGAPTWFSSTPGSRRSTRWCRM